MTQSTEDWPLPALLESRKAYQERLNLILPHGITGVTATANPAASAIVFVAMYVGAIGNNAPIRPSTVTWMSDAVAERRTDTERRGYYRAAMRGEKGVVSFCEGAEVERGKIWYANNSREPVRDESIDALIDNGAVLNIRTDLSTNSPLARYTLDDGFAALLSPDLAGDELHAAITRWSTTHLSPTGRRRAQLRRDPSLNSESVPVNLPGAGVRTLHPGASSWILKGVAEEFSTRLREPNVLFISQPGEKVNLLDGRALEAMGISVDQANLLPDCLMADLDDERDEVWFIEAVFSGGEITNERKQSLLAWADLQGLSAEKCRFLSAFESRTHAEARRALPTLADGSFAWFSDEPEYLLTWDSVGFD
ncbi:restriction endonuclease [Streptomyces glebosus]|uniref:Restriction endonuclease n=1 Tax=Streptomyces glebosus TaxID=249580 RepID=A0A640T268_9ACTN|nr:BsuBI/PstI family type II restriction endonuclease [Streptomyces glebosus]GFE15725.1 restriction endonuclease [Streptomyces glebosus]GHG52231.1 restriction endonuclease [Streptomyces glebosus]